MSNISLSPGDTLTLNTTAKIETLNGSQNISVPIIFSYEELVDRLNKTAAGKKTGKNKFSSLSRFSKTIAIAARTLTTGKWHQKGTPADKEKVMERIFTGYAGLGSTDKTLSEQAATALVVVWNNSFVQAHQKKDDIKKMLDTFSIDPAEHDGEAKTLAASYKSKKT